jgi:alpha-L-arabinofuranosidase
MSGTMRIILLITVVYNLGFSGLFFSQGSYNRTLYKVTDREMFSAPVSILLYGNFLEPGYGVQVEPMISEMLFNPSFEEFMPYRVPSIMWFDLYYDENDRSKGYEKDWSKFGWYHSGYEHNTWFAAPGTPPDPAWIDDTSTFFQTSTQEGSIQIIPVKEGAVHGNQCLLVKNPDKEKWLAVAQEGKYFKKGERYSFRGMIKPISGVRKLEIRIFPEGNWKKPIQVIPLELSGDDFSEFTSSFENDDYTGFATFSLWIPPSSSVVLDDFSFTFSDNYHGWRTDVVELIRSMSPGVIRFPGGCFASFYDWKEGIGPHSERVPSGSYFWGGQNNNDVGIAEFAMLCKKVGAEMNYCVNMHHPSKRTYDTDFPNEQVAHGFNLNKFMSLSEGANSAAELVAYCNLPAGAHPMADLRVAHGYREPFGVKYFEIENEPMRWFNAEDYAHAVVVYSQAMKAVDPNIQIGLATYGDRLGWTSSDSPMAYRNKLDEMLEIAGPYIDFLADRGDAAEITKYMIEKVRGYNTAHDNQLKYCDTEWLAFYGEHKRDPFNKAEREGNMTNSYKFSKWLYGLNLMKNFLSFQRMGEEMLFVNFNNMANTHSQSSLESPRDGKAYLTASGRALELLANSPMAWLLEFEKYSAEADDDFQVQAGWDRNREKLVLYICNRTEEMRQIEFDLSQVEKNYSHAVYTVLSGEPLAMNTLENPDAISKESYSRKMKSGSVTLKIDAYPYSFTEIVLE